jgi:preprotein translocase subunit SecG
MAGRHGTETLIHISFLAAKPVLKGRAGTAGAPPRGAPFSRGRDAANRAAASRKETDGEHTAFGGFVICFLSKHDALITYVKESWGFAERSDSADQHYYPPPDLCTVMIAAFLFTGFLMFAPILLQESHRFGHVFSGGSSSLANAISFSLTTCAFAAQLLFIILLGVSMIRRQSMAELRCLTYKRRSECARGRSPDDLD